MLLGRVSGKVTTTTFSFDLVPGIDVKKFEYVTAQHRTYGPILCQVVEVEVTSEHTKATCTVIGFAQDGAVKQPRIPLDLQTEVHLAEDAYIGDVIRISAEKGAYLGKLDGKDIKVHLDLSKLLTKHVAVLAKSGSGKSYAVGVLVEEVLDRRVPVLIIDPHGEYATLREKSEDTDALAKFDVKAKGYTLREYGDPSLPDVTPLRLPSNLSQQELVQLIPKLSSTQLGVLYSAIKHLDEVTFDALLPQLEQEESNAKWSIINMVEHLRELGIFSNTPVAYNELVKSGVCTVINLRGMPPEIQQIVVYKLGKDLFELRKAGQVPPFFMVVEEAHNYCPERSFGEATSSKILRAIASEGRKFGLGLCVVSQRPARVDKSVLSQCTTQLILKVTNPNDLKAISSSVEGLTVETEREIQHLPIGTALVTGVVDVPLFVQVRPRKTLHGGHAVDILDQPEDFLAQQKTFKKSGTIPVIRAGRPGGKAIALVPAYLFTCKDKDLYKILVDMSTGEIVVNAQELRTAMLPDLAKLNPMQLKLLPVAFALQRFSKEELMKKARVGLAIDDELKGLIEQEYLRAEKDLFVVTQRYVLAKLSSYACASAVQFEQIDAPKLPSSVNLDRMKIALARFTTVIDQQECFIVKS